MQGTRFMTRDTRQKKKNDRRPTRGSLTLVILGSVERVSGKVGQDCDDKESIIQERL